VAIYRGEIMPFGIKLSDFSLNLGFVTVTFEPEELDETLTSLITEMRAITSGLRDGERATLKKIMASESKTLTVQDLFDPVGFKRDSDDHATLRKLRDAQFIRPAGGGSWAAHKHVEIKRFGRLMWDKIGERKLFGE
jgi:hypothetical protein